MRRAQHRHHSLRAAGLLVTLCVYVMTACGSAVPAGKDSPEAGASPSANLATLTASPTGSVRIDLDTNQELAYEAVLIGRSGPALYISADHGDCAATPYVSGLGFLPGTTVEVYGWPEGGNSVALVAEPLSVGEDGTFTAPLDLARFTGCASQTGASGFYGKHFGITAVTRRNSADALNGFADPAANAGFTVLNPEQDATPGAAP